MADCAIEAEQDILRLIVDLTRSSASDTGGVDQATSSVRRCAAKASAKEMVANRKRARVDRGHKFSEEGVEARNLLFEGSMISDLAAAGHERDGSSDHRAVG